MGLWLEGALRLRERGLGKDKKDLSMFNGGREERADRERLKIREEKGLGEEEGSKMIGRRGTG